MANCLRSHSLLRWMTFLFQPFSPYLRRFGAFSCWDARASLGLQGLDLEMMSALLIVVSGQIRPPKERRFPHAPAKLMPQTAYGSLSTSIGMWAGPQAFQSQMPRGCSRVLPGPLFIEDFTYKHCMTPSEGHASQCITVTLTWRMQTSQLSFTTVRNTSRLH